MSDDRIDEARGLEFFVIGDGDDEEEDRQCARCGSSVGLYDDRCLSSAIWCNEHPLPGREHIRGAGHGG